MTFSERLLFCGMMEEVGAIDVFESTFLTGTRRDADADGGGRKAVPPGRGGAGMLLNVGGFRRGGLWDRREGVAICGGLRARLGECFFFCSGSDVWLWMVPLLRSPGLAFWLCDAGSTGCSASGTSKVKDGLSSL